VRVVQCRVRIRQSYLDAFLAAGVTATADIRASVKVPDPTPASSGKGSRTRSPRLRPGSGTSVTLPWPWHCGRCRERLPDWRGRSSSYRT
jgi:hypothetical protein